MDNHAHALERIDPLTDCENLIAFLEKLFSLLLIDLRLYNTINYSEGDQMIKDLSTVLAKTCGPVTLAPAGASAMNFLWFFLPLKMRRR